jgi:hypothetical protein
MTFGAPDGDGAAVSSVAASGAASARGAGTSDRGPAARNVSKSACPAVTAASHPRTTRGAVGAHGVKCRIAVADACAAARATVSTTAHSSGTTVAAGPRNGVTRTGIGSLTAAPTVPARGAVGTRGTITADCVSMAQGRRGATSTTGAAARDPGTTRGAISGHCVQRRISVGNGRVATGAAVAAAAHRSSTALAAGTRVEMPSSPQKHCGTAFSAAAADSPIGARGTMTAHGVPGAAGDPPSAGAPIAAAGSPGAARGAVGSPRIERGGGVADDCVTSRAAGSPAANTSGATDTTGTGVQNPGSSRTR